MRKLFAALAFALVLLVPGTPAPTRAGTFQFVIPGPVIFLIETNEPLTEVFGLACIGAAGSSVRWIAVATDSEGQIDQGYVGGAAKLKDKPDKLKAKFSDKAKDAASEDIQHIDEDSDADTGTVEGVKAGMKGKVAKYVVDPVAKVEFAGTSGRVKVNDKTNKEKLTIDANLAAKVTATSCTVSFDDTAKAVSLRVSGLPGGKSLKLGRGR